jgi:hypothetical protein
MAVWHRAWRNGLLQCSMRLNLGNAAFLSMDFCALQHKIRIIDGKAAFPGFLRRAGTDYAAARRRADRQRLEREI